ncbi:hypothetical protein ACVLD2_003263 [Paenibacillus sp. PvR052]|nr:hypothetical protein [Paenibacillus sp. PvP091]MBP1170951.1 hypothetical protein [Paenibacillus sp. PvR098]MBP2441979.1 hypothetical protein [Paenibacillus sp. PvP052]
MNSFRTAYFVNSVLGRYRGNLEKAIATFIPFLSNFSPICRVRKRNMVFRIRVNFILGENFQITFFISLTTSSGKLKRLSRDPPQLSSRLLKKGEKKFCSKNPCAPWISTPSKPASMARLVVCPKASITSIISSCESSLGNTDGANAVASVSTALELTTSPFGVKAGSALLPA